MKHSTLAVVILLVIGLPIASASFGYPTVQKYIDIYNNKVDSAPDILKSLLGNERIDMDITMNDGSLLNVGLETEKGRISQMIQGSINDSTISVVTTESAINTIMASKDPITAFQEEMDYGQVRIEGHNLATRMKLNAVLSSTSVLKFFAGIFFG